MIPTSFIDTNIQEGLSANNYLVCRRGKKKCLFWLDSGFWNNMFYFNSHFPAYGAAKL